jgi:hypothetical protein
MKKFLLFVAVVVCCRDVLAQTIIERKNKLIDNVTERFDTYIEADKQIKHGSYKAFFARKIVIASGKYLNDKKVGVWHYFDRNGKLMQNYDFDAKKLLFEEPEVGESALRYAIDDTIRANDKVTQPVRIGGRYFGYIPYIKLFKLPSEAYQEAVFKNLVTFELLISPMGRLYDMMVHVRSGASDADQHSYIVNVDLLSDDDKVFIPATFNGKPIASRVNFICYMDGYGLVDM